MTKHTPGPWEVDSDERTGIVYISSHLIGSHDVCDLYHVADCEIITKENAMANAHLIAAAPDLLEACKAAAACRFVAKHPEDNKVFWETERTLGKAIAKAEAKDAGN